MSALPDVGYIRLEDEESGEQILVDTSDPTVREEYAKLASEHENQLKNKLSRMKIGCVDISSDTSINAAMVGFFRRLVR